MRSNLLLTAVRRALFLLLGATISSVLTAGPIETVSQAQTAPPENPWSFSLTSYGWGTFIDGTISAGNRSADVDVSLKNVLKHLDMAWFMGAEVRYKRWGLTGDLVYARLHDDIAPPAGILFSGTHEVLKETLVTLELSYRVVDSKQTFLDLFAGARIYNFYSQIRLLSNFPGRGIDVDGTNTWADPIVGLRARYYVSHALFLNLYGDIGGFGAGSDFSWQVLGSAGVQASRWCDLQLGYRALGFDYEPGNKKQDLVTHGPIIGATFHF